MKTAIIAGAVVIGGALLYVLVKKKPGESMAGSAGRAVVGAVGDAAAGVVVGIGEAVGIPQTSLARCESDLANGRTYEASFSCPASKFIGGVLGRSTLTNGVAQDDLRQIDRQLEREKNALEPLYAYYEPTYDLMGNYTGSQPKRYGATGGW